MLKGGGLQPTILVRLEGKGGEGGGVGDGGFVRGGGGGRVKVKILWWLGQRG